MFDLTWTDVLKLVAVPVLSFFLGRGAQKQKNKIDDVTAAQKTTEQLWKRIESLESKVETNTDNLEKLRNEKLLLTTEIIALKQQISLLEITKAQYETDRVMFLAQIAEMEQRLTLKGEELRCAEEKLKHLENIKTGELPF